MRKEKTGKRRNEMQKELLVMLALRLMARLLRSLYGREQNRKRFVAGDDCLLCVNVVTGSLI